MFNENNFDNNVAIVTGAGSGMGMAVAKLLAMNGAKVVLSDINKQSILLMEQELNDLGFDAKAIQGDVRNSKDVNNIIEQTVSKAFNLFSLSK